jgi:hypothetical protein
VKTPYPFIHRRLVGSTIVAVLGDVLAQLVAMTSLLTNFRLVNRELMSDPRDAWQLVVDTGSFAHHTTAPHSDDAVVAGETHQYRLKRCLLDKIRTFFKANPSWK